MNNIFYFLRLIFISLIFSICLYIYRLYSEVNLMDIKNISIVLLFYIIFYKMFIFCMEKLNKYRNEKFLSDNIEIPLTPFHKGKGVASHFYSKGTKVKIGDYILKNPMVYITSSLDIGIGEKIPFLIFSEMNLKFSFKKKNIDPTLQVNNYVQLSQSEKKYYLKWLSNKKLSPKNINFLFLYLKGLEYRSLCEKKDQKIIFDEIVDLIKKYKKETNIGELNNYLFNFLKILLNEPNIYSIFLNKEQFHLFLTNNGININEKEYHLLMWNFLNNKKEKNNGEIIVYFYLKNKRYINYYNQRFHNIFTLICKGIFRKKQLIITKIEHKYDNFILKSNEYKFKDEQKILKLLDKIMIELKPFINEFTKKDEIESYSSLPIRYKKIVPHKLEPVLSPILKKNYVLIDDIVERINLIDFKDSKLSYTDSKKISRILNDLFYAVEPDSKFTGKNYKQGEIVAVYKNGSQLICKNPNFKTKQYIVDLISSQINSFNNENIAKIQNFIEKNYPSVNEEERIRTEKRIRLNFKKRTIDLRSLMSFSYKEEDINNIVSFLTENKISFGIKDHRIEKIKENYIK